MLREPVSMIMCAYNEEKHIKEIILEYYDEIYRHLPSGSEFIVYLDGPTDNTSYIVKELAKEIDIKVIDAEKNLGYAKATTAALKATKNNIVFYSDSSSKHRASDFWRLAKYEGEYDLVSGLRKPRTDELIRRIITFVQRGIISVCFLMPFYDFNTGYKLLHRNVVEDILDDCKYMEHSFSSELTIRAYKKGYLIKSVPVLFRKRKYKGAGTNYKKLPKIIYNALKGFYFLKKEMYKN